MGFPLWAAFEEKPFSARSAALSGSLVGGTLGLDASHENPGALAFTERPGVTGGHSRLFGDEDLGLRTLSGAFGTPAQGAFGFFLSDFGSALYRERELGISWAARLADRASLGTTLKRQEVRMERYGTLGAFQLDVGLFGRPAPKVTAGVAVKNLTRSRWGGAVESPPSLFSAGCSVEVLAQGATSLAVVQESGGASSWRVGQEAWLHSTFAVRAGLETKPNRFSLGMGFRHPFFAVDYAFLTHPQLPDQHFFNLSYFP
ncbi:MAG: hypothetical protein JNK54_05490 [Elusimicrobia bacterium]|jgi:hypothetical protein|nr:hypothetical protein [Elusimicrobiota bacterium]